ncbi:uncharacterized protein I303_108259 [Kwoniella dejecticola CBS 10117]|uniref:GC-rich sequence DNA-binding factor n=1 Tax=Kwoniella dejecticola CBS 10117 TaxID=1296121 RepID=A0A1A5ZXX0_9TREE|nr:GC-rich sequence DNA-binding factor [Kwoniella dejecticola CBS 10117]OBR82651.1 GC-rich sequence DNA-binding factor [Kwoniella dejecticola CBS 10117]
MFIKRAKSRPSLRARDSDLHESSTAGSPLAKSSVTAEDAGDVSMDVDPDESSGSVMERKKNQKKERRKDGSSSKSKTASRLSFGGGEQEEGESSTPFKPKKSLLSQQIKLPTSSSSTSLNTPSSSNGISSIYSREYLSELKASTPTRAPRSAEVHDAEEDEDDNGDGLSRIARDKYSTSIVEDTTAGIPDTAAIAAAKAKRQAALESAKHGGNEEDYISLGNSKLAIYDGDSGPHPESRLQREEDEEGDGDEDMADYTEANDKLYLGREANRAAARRLKGEIGEMIAEREAEDEDDEETLEWERAQAQRAGRWEDEKPHSGAKQSYKPAPIPTARPIPTISSAQSRLAKSLADLELTRTTDEHNLETVARDLAALEKDERELRLEVEKVEGKREWVEEFRNWVEMLGVFLEEKFPKLENIESDSMAHLKERASMVDTRRSADDSDDLSLFLGVAAPVEGGEVKDEFGRSTESEAGPSSIRRKIRRDERIARRGKRRSKAFRAVGEDEGYSTDSSLAEGDQEDYRSAQHNLERRVHALLDDVKAEEFRDPEKGIAIRFGGWRSRYEEEYVNAFGGLALVQAWEFWARGEMVGWEPLRSSKSLDSFSWFHALHHYSHPPLPRPDEPQEDDMDLDEEPPLGPDGDLVASMVSSAVVPLLTKAFEAGAYDPYSAGQTRRAVDLFDMVKEMMGKDSKKYTTLLKAVLGVYHECLVSLSSTISSVLSPGAIPPPAFDPASKPAMERYITRRIKLIKNIALWRREAPQETRELVVRLVGEIIRPVLSKTWDGGGQQMASKVLAAATGLLRPDLVGWLQQGPGSRW